MFRGPHWTTRMVSPAHSPQEPEPAMKPKSSGGAPARRGGGVPPPPLVVVEPSGLVVLVVVEADVLSSGERKPKAMMLTAPSTTAIARPMSHGLTWAGPAPAPPPPLIRAGRP